MQQGRPTSSSAAMRRALTSAGVQCGHVVSCHEDEFFRGVGGVGF